MSQDQSEAKHDAISIVMLAQPRFPDGPTLLAAIRRRVPDFPDPVSGDPGSALVTFYRRQMCTMMFMGVPNPLGPDESCIRSAWWWRDAWEQLERRQAHVIVSVGGAINPHECYGTLARLVAAVVETTPAIGVSWSAADAVWPADMFRNSVDQAGDGLPLSQLVSIKFGQDTQYPRPDGGEAILAMTWGLAAFGLMEIEVRGFAGAADKLATTLLDLAAYLITSGPVIQDGNTVGPDVQTKFLVRHENSTLAPGRKVYRLYMTGTPAR